MKNDFLEISRTLSKLGYKDVLILKHENAKKVLTEKRMEIIETLRERSVKSIRELSRILGRGVNVVYEDLQFLAEEGVIDFEIQGRSKKPVLRHELVWIEPIELRKEMPIPV